jgi:hypothetical protein
VPRPPDPRRDRRVEDDRGTLAQERSAFCTVKNTPLTLISNIRSNSSSVVASTGPPPLTPAVANRISSAPNRCLTDANSASMAFRSRHRCATPAHRRQAKRSRHRGTSGHAR